MYVWHSLLQTLCTCGNFFVLPCCYEAKGHSFPFFTGSQKGSDLPEAIEGSGNGAVRNHLLVSPRLVDLGKEKMRKEKADLTGCKELTEKKKSTLLMGLQVCLTKCRRAAQHVWMCDTETQEEGLVYLLPTHVSCAFSSLSPLPSTPVHLSTRICISSLCSDMCRHRAVILEVSLIGTGVEP